jgi:hypothetical protein
MGGSSPKTQTTTTTDEQQNQSQTSGKTSGTTAGTEFGQTTADIPDFLQPYIQGAFGTAGNALGDLSQGVQGWNVPQQSINALTNTAAGNYLYGGPGQQEFIDASVRAALPGINSQFEMAGRPGGGLYGAQVAQQAQDAYARMYGDERARQLNAAQILPGITQMPLQLQSQLATLAGQLPGQAAPFLGRTVAGQTTGTSTGKTSSATSGSSSGTSTQTQPLYQTPWWQTALGAGAALGGLAMPGLGGVSALGNIGTGLFGSQAMNTASQGGLLGMFR